MRAVRCAGIVLTFAIVGFTSLNPESAQAACKWFKATHNGTDFFYSDGAAGTAEWKVKSYIESWATQRGIKRKKIYLAKTRCGDWFIKYMLPHKHCIAKAKVCY